MKLSDSEKLILLMLCEVYKSLNIKGDIDPKFVEAAIHGGHYWGLEWDYPGIFHGVEDNETTATEVCDILDMWDFVERAYGTLSKADKDRIETEADPFGKNVVFLGFDGNNESEHMGIAIFLIHEMGRFSGFKDRDLNSHGASIDGYRRMLATFKPIRGTLSQSGLSTSQIIELLIARTHP